MDVDVADSAGAGWVDIVVGGVDSTSVEEMSGYSAECVTARCDDTRSSIY